MRCSTARRHCSAGLDGELDARGAARLNRHLADCPACRDFAAGISQDAVALRLLAAPPAGAFAARVMGGLPSQAPWWEGVLGALPRIRPVPLALAAGAFWLGVRAPAPAETPPDAVSRSQPSTTYLSAPADDGPEARLLALLPAMMEER